MDYNVEKLQKINSVFTETAGLYHRLNVALGLPDSVADVLYLLYANDGCYSIRELCTDLDIPKQTVTSALRNLEKQDILFLETINRKKKRVVLTEKGMQFCNDTIAPIFRIEKLAFEEFTASEIEAFVTLHEKYNAALGKHIDEYVRSKDGRE